MGMLHSLELRIPLLLANRVCWVLKMLLALSKGPYKWPWYRKYFKHSLKEIKGKISDSVRSFHKLQKVERSILQ